MSQSLIHQLACTNSRVRKRTLEILASWDSKLENRQVAEIEAWESCKRELTVYYREADRRASQSRRDRLRNAEQACNWYEQCEQSSMEPEDYAQEYVDKLAAEQVIKKIQHQQIEDQKNRSRFNWLREGEHSNKLFFQMFKKGKQANDIPKVTVDGVTATDHPHNKSLIESSFRKTFTKRVPNPAALAQVTQAIKNTNRVLTDSQKEKLGESMNLRALQAHHRDKLSTQLPSESWLHIL